MYKYVQNKQSAADSGGISCVRVSASRSPEPREQKKERLHIRDDDIEEWNCTEMKQTLRLNLSVRQYITAVKDQPKPLIIPLCAELPLPDISPLEIYRHLRTGCGFLLESMEGSEKIARYSYIGIDPEFVITTGPEVSVS